MIEPFTLTGRHVRLEPLAAAHVDGLAAAAAEERGSYGYTWVPDGPDETARYVEAALEHASAGRAVPFAVRRLADGVLVGSTWYAASAQRTAINTECKLLLLTHAFETWRSLRVTLKTDARNAASRRAIERIGGRFEGVRRVHTVATDGSLRDTAYFSIVAAEWFTVRAGLVARLG